MTLVLLVLMLLDLLNLYVLVFPVVAFRTPCFDTVEISGLFLGDVLTQPLRYWRRRGVP